MSAIVPRSRLFEDFFKDFSPGYLIRPLHGDALPSPSQIKIDVKESDAAFTVQAELPGIGKDEIQVSVDGNVVTLQAEVKQSDSQSSERSLRSERYYGAVSRSFALPADIDEANAKAKYDNGVLTLTLPKQQGKASRRLSVE